ncbi:nucleoside-diphosphate-sugar epimerase family protein [Xylariaceae sp. FL0255]|nr:nucleoside-diphosphate-sugar epimerase family protein [Xylariaceae sp. FL0255]
MMSTQQTKLLIVGATGQQGGAVLQALSSTPTSSSLQILLLTRNPDSKKAQALVKTYSSLNIQLIKGDTRDPSPIFDANPDISAVFAYTTPPAADEGAQANALIDVAAQRGVQRFVFSSVDRGGEEKSWENPTDVPHFVSKHNIEHHLRQTCEATPSMTYTILRPAAFMDNLNPTSPFGAVMASLWYTMPADTKLQMVSVRDIGLIGARALLSPSSFSDNKDEDSKFANRAISLAGDTLTLADARSIYRRVLSSQLPQAWSIVGYGVRWAVGEVGKMFSFFETQGYGADIPDLRALEPRLQDFETWLKESSKFACAAK